MRVATSLVIVLAFGLVSCSSKLQGLSEAINADATSTQSPQSATEEDPDFSSANLKSTEGPLVSHILSMNPFPLPSHTDFEFDEGVADYNREAIVRAISLANYYFSQLSEDLSIPVTVHAFADCENIRKAYNEYLEVYGKIGNDNNRECGGGGFAHAEAVFIQITPSFHVIEKTDVLAELVIHEYFHVIQELLANNLTNPRHLEIPPWFMEGGAVYFAELVMDQIVPGHINNQVNWKINYLRTNTVTISDLGNDYQRGHEYLLGPQVVSYLTEKFGFAAYLAVFTHMSNDLTFDQSLIESFGLSHSNINGAFEDFRNRNFPFATGTPTLSGNLGRITGKLTDSFGNPLGRAYVVACPVIAELTCPEGYTGEDGAFSLEVEAVAWYFGIMLDGLSWTGFYYEPARNNFTQDQLSGSVIGIGAGQTKELNIQIPRELVELVPVRIPIEPGYGINDPNKPCGLDISLATQEYFQVTGRVVSLSGGSVSGWDVILYSVSDDNVGGASTDSNGRFGTGNVNGVYLVGIKPEGSTGEPIGFYRPEEVITLSERNCDMALIINGREISGVEILIP